jgi:hypothetical protein
MTEAAVAGFLDRASVGWEKVEKLLATKKLRAVCYRGFTFYVRRWSHGGDQDRGARP